MLKETDCLTILMETGEYVRETLKVSLTFALQTHHFLCFLVKILRGVSQDPFTHFVQLFPHFKVGTSTHL